VRAVLGRREEALPLARAAIAAAPDSLEPRLLLARLLVETKRFGEADSTLTEASRRHPRDAGLLLELASMREERGDDHAAEAAARDALRIEPDNARALNFLGYLMADHDRRLPEAMELIRRALAAEPDNGAFVDSMGWLLFRMGRFDDARVQLERAVELTGGDPTVREHLGDAYRKLRQQDRAREQYRLAAERDSTNTRLRDKRDAVRP
jgi:predicted Zn-dependent protease